MAYGKRTDSNQKEIVKTFRYLGARVVITSMVGGGFTDAVVQYWYPNRRCHNLETMLVEIKDGSRIPSERKLTPEQIEFHAKFVCHIVETVRDVYELLEVNYQD